MKRIAVTVAFVFLGSLVGCIVLDNRSRGIADAKRRLRNGELVSKTPNGRHADGFGEYCRILREEHGLYLESTLGETEEYVQGFKSVMEPEIERRFDRDFFGSVWAQVRAKSDSNKP